MVLRQKIAHRKAIQTCGISLLCFRNCFAPMLGPDHVSRDADCIVSIYIKMTETERSRIDNDHLQHM